MSEEPVNSEAQQPVTPPPAGSNENSDIVTIFDVATEIETMLQEIVSFI